MRGAARIFQQSQSLGSLGDVPLMVISRGTDLDGGWGELQDELAALSTNSAHMIVEDSTHVSLIFNPDHAQVVSQAILQVVGSVQTGKRLNS